MLSQKKIIRHVSNHAIVTRVFDAWKQHFDEVQRPMQSQQWRLIYVHIKFWLYSWYFTAWNKYVPHRIVRPRCFNRQFFIIRRSSNSRIKHFNHGKNIGFYTSRLQCLKIIMNQITFIQLLLKNFVNLHDIHLYWANKDVARLNFDIIISQMLLEFFYWNMVLQKINQVIGVIPTQMRICTLSRDFLHIHKVKLVKKIYLTYSLNNSICGLMINLAYNAVNLGWDIALTFVSDYV